MKYDSLSELELITSRTIIEFKCSKCSQYKQIRKSNLLKNIKNNGKFICFACKYPPSKKTRRQNQTEANCQECQASFLVSKDSYDRNIKKNGIYLCASCSRAKTGFKQLSQHSVEQNRQRWKDPEFKERFKLIMNSPEVLDRISKASIKNWENSSYRQKVNESVANSTKVSNIQGLLYEYLKDLGVEFYEESDKTVISKWRFDCLIPKQNAMYKNLLIECQGDYWHSLSGKQTSDRQKFTTINRYFPEYEIMYLWEHEFCVEGRILDRLKLKLGIEIQSHEFDFKDVTIKESSYDDVKKFLDAYHYMGGRRGGIAVGAFLGDELIACVLYSKPVRQNIEFDLEYRELSRFCIHPSYHKKNFGSWFLSKTYKYLDVPLIISYADTTVGHVGSLYKASNFKYSHEVRPDYWYVDEDNRVMNKKTLYDRAKKYKITESEYAEKYNFRKKYGGKKLCFIKEI